MKRLALLSAVFLIAIVSPACAENHAEKYELGNLYTKTLNLIESQGMLDTLGQKEAVRVTDIHLDHGQVFVTVMKAGTSSTFIYNLIAGRLVPQA